MTERPEADPNLIATAALHAMRGESPVIPEDSPTKEACEEAVAVINQLAAVEAARTALRNAGIQ